MFKESDELLVGDSWFVEVHNSQIFFWEVVSEQGFEVSRPRRKDHLVTIHLLVFYDKGHIAKVFFIEDWNEVLLQVVVVAGSHDIVCISVILGAGALLSDGCEASNILQTVIWVVLLIWWVQRIVTWRVEIVHAMRVLTLPVNSFLIGLTRFPNNLLLIVPRLNVCKTTLVFDLKIVSISTHCLCPTPI